MLPGPGRETVKGLPLIALVLTRYDPLISPFLTQKSTGAVVNLIIQAKK
jgi:hypothetical protein